jgi:hypothetical protein
VIAASEFVGERAAVAKIWDETFAGAGTGSV